MKHLILWKLLIFIFVIFPLQAADFSNNFETFSLGDLDGQGAWSVYSGSAEVTSEDAHSGLQSIKIFGATNAYIQRNLNAHEGGPVFTDFYAKLVVSEGETGEIISLNQSVLWFLKQGESGIFHVLDGDGAGGDGRSFMVPPSFALDADERTTSWVRLTFRQDFSSGYWDLYINGELAAINLGFADVVSTSLFLGIHGDDTTHTYIDTFSYGDVNPLFADSDNDGMPDAWEQAEGTDPYTNDRDEDLEPDQLTNIEEYLHGTKPLLSDSDGDGFSDDIEIATGSNANDPLDIPAGLLKLAASKSSSSADELYIYEPFDYPAGSGSGIPATGLGLTGSINFGFSTDAFIANSVEVGSLDVLGGAFERTNNPWWNENGMTLNWDSTFHDCINLVNNDTEELWLSFTAKTPSDINNKSFNFTFFSWGTTYGIEVDSNSNEARAFIGNSYAAARTLNPDTNYLYVSKLFLDKSAGATKVSIDLWVYAEGETLPTTDLGAPHATLSNIQRVNDWTINNLNLSYRTQGTPGANLPPYTLDEIRIGNSQAVVLPGVLSTVSLLPAPTISPAGGSYNSYVEVAISTDAPDATLYYTLDGSDPDPATSAVYTNPLLLTSSTTVKALYVTTDNEVSATASEDYSITGGGGLPILYEPFNYAPASPAPSQPTTATGVTGNLNPGQNDSVLAGSLSHSSLETSAGSYQMGNNPWWTSHYINFTPTSNVLDTLNLANTTQDTVWLSVLVDTPADLNGKSLTLSFNNGNGAAYGLTLESTTNTAGAFVSYTTQQGQSLQPDTTYLHIARLTIDRTAGPRTVAIDHWYYASNDAIPTSEGALGTPQSNVSTTNLNPDWPINTMQVVYNTPSTPGTALDTYGLDEIRIGQSYADVVPGIISSVTLGDLSGRLIILDDDKRNAATLTLQNTATLTEYTIPVSSDGSFSFGPLIAGNYSLTADAPSHLANTQTITINGTTDAGDIYLTAGDLDNNGIIDINDFNIMDATFFKTTGDGGYNEAADLISNDNHINIKDLVILGVNFGKSE